MHGNKMGPEQEGPKTGRGFGFCYGWGKPGYMSNNSPRRMGRGNGQGRGYRANHGTKGGFGFRDGSVDSKNAKLKARIEELEKALGELKN